MNNNIERIIITVAVVSFAFTSGSLLNIREVPLTREEAIEISKGSSLYKHGINAHPDSVRFLWARYHNSQEIERLARANIFLAWKEKLPKGHTVWEVSWSRWIKTGQHFIVIVDAEVGVIIYETLTFELHSFSFVR